MDGSDDKSAGQSSSNNDQRLPSFKVKGPRDLKLSVPRSRVAVPGRRTFAPNIPTRDRNAQGRGGESASSSSGKDGQSQGQGGADGGGDGSKRGRFKPNVRGGRKKDAAQFVQMESSIFADGVGSATVGKYRAPSATGGGGAGGSRKLQSLLGSAHGGPMKGDVKKVLKQEAADRSGFISDLQQAEDDSVAPVTIPLCSYLEGPPSSSLDLMPDPEVSKISEEFQTIGLTSKSFANLISQASSQGTVVLLQIPEHLPLLVDKDEAEGTTPNNEPAVLTTGITNFPEGLLGKTQILTSGLSRLSIGRNHFNIDVGTQPPFYQELILATEDSFMSLGPVHHKYLCTTEVDTFLNQVS